MILEAIIIVAIISGFILCAIISIFKAESSSSSVPSAEQARKKSEINRRIREEKEKELLIKQENLLFEELDRRICESVEKGYSQVRVSEFILSKFFEGMSFIYQDEVLKRIESHYHSLGYTVTIRRGFHLRIEW